MIPNIEGKSERYIAFNDGIHFFTSNIQCDKSTMTPIPRKEAEGRTGWPHRRLSSNILDMNPQFLQFVQILLLG